MKKKRKRLSDKAKSMNVEDLTAVLHLRQNMDLAKIARRSSRPTDESADKDEVDSKGADAES